MTPNVSVILTVYNTEAYLEQCLDSLVAQTLTNIEIICVDDASSDTGVSIIKKYQKADSRITLIELSENKGANFARNMALKKVCGQYVVILDADDFYERDFLEKLYNQAQKTKADIVFCGFDLFDNALNAVRKISWDIERRLLPKEEVFVMTPKLFDLLPSFVWNQLYRRKFIKENNLYFADISCYTDVYFNKTALLKAKRISYVDEKLVYYRVNNSHSISHNLSYSGAIRTIYALAEFLKKENLFERYQTAFFETSLLKMNRSMSVAEPYCGLLRSFYQRYLINKFWPDVPIPKTYEMLKKFDNCSAEFKKLFFTNRDRVIPVVMACDDKTLSLIGVVIQSILDNSNPEYFYDIYVMTSRLSAEKCFNLQMLSKSNIRVSTIDMSDKNSQDIGFRRYWFYIPKLFDGYDKILYLDYKTLVQSDLVDLFKLDLKNKPLAAIKSALSKEDKKRYKKVFKLNLENYIDSCVMLFNLPLVKEMNLSEVLLTENKRWRAQIATDTELLNISCYDYAAELDSRFARLIFLNENVSSLQTITNSSAILSYDFPPQCKLINQFAQIWWMNARNSIFYEQLIRDAY